MLLLAACGGDDSGGGGGNGDAAVADGSSSDAAAGACLAGTYDIDKAWGFTQGPYAIAGTVTLPAPLQSGRGIQLNIVQVSPDTGNSVDFAIVSATTSMVTYRARGLVDGTWRICLRADADGNNMLNDVAVDYTGCYDGTVAAPITTTTSATPIALGGMCRSGMDFGLGYY
jgi:hypothetical protein